ncbi:MAG TPA: hypothetical protein DCO75_02030 [Fibrobacteres bacterium]|nr:hypothetical protein [Fibrobacterota bacterium]
MRNKKRNFIMTSKESSKKPASNPGLLKNQTQSVQEPSVSTEVETITKQKLVLINRVVILILMVTVLFVFIPMLKIFFTPMLLACTFASLFFPFYTFILKLFRGNRGLAAFSCCVIILIGIVIPFYFLGYLVVHQLFTLYGSTEPAIKALINGEHTGFLSHFNENHILSRLSQLNINWQTPLLDTLKTAGSIIAKMINKTSIGAIGIIISFIVTLFIMFYLFMDGERIVKKLRMLLPIRLEYQDMIITRFLLVSRATIKGTIVIASIQGSLGAIILLVFGIKTWLLWGVVMTALALIPMMGAWIVLIPAGIIQMATGNMWHGIVIIALSFGVVSNVDNILRPRLVGQSARMHDLLIFFSTIGGLTMFGPVGVITGPVIMAFFVSITEIYMKEMKEHLGGL